MDNLNSYLEAAARCSRCGACAVNCPVFLVSQEESLLARGKLNLIETVLKEESPLSREIEKRLNACLLCGACAAGCPSEVPADKIILAAREEAVKKYGLPALKSLAFQYIIPSRWRFGLGLKSLSFLQNLLPLASKNTPAYRHLPFSFLGFSSQVAIPSLTSQPLTKLWQEIKIARPKMRVAFFSGCLIEYVYPEIGLALQKILSPLKIQVIKPKQSCCATPIIMSGELSIAKKMGEENVNNFLHEDFDFIVTACASCGSTLKNFYPHLLEKTQPLVNDFSSYVLDINEFLVKHTDITKHLADLKLTATYHDPCHLSRHQGITKEPRQLIEAAGTQLKEMENADRCCGNGGTFSIYYPELSEKILQLKIQNILAAEADYLVTACPGCLLQLRRGLAQNKAPLKALHTVELLSAALSG